MEQRKIFDPLTETDEVALAKRCPLCSEKFKVGDVTTYINPRPDGPEEAMKMHANQSYRAIADLTHVTCIKKKADAYVASIMAQRTEILEAFIAKHRCQPDEAVQIQAGNKWLVQKIDEDDRKQIRTMMITVDETSKLMVDVKCMTDMIAEAISLLMRSPDGIKALPLTDESRAAYQRLKDWLENPPAESLVNVIPMTIPKDGKLPSC